MSSPPHTPEEYWRGVGRLEHLPDLELTLPDGSPAEHLLVVVAHPDDETLAVGGLVHDAGLGGLRTTILVATDGEASHPRSPTHCPGDLSRIRGRELAAAVALLNPASACHRLGLEDGLLSARVEDLTREISTHCDAGTIVVSTWRHDGHPDHEAVARAAAAATDALGCRHLEAPIWAWAWTTERDVPWRIASRHRCSLAALRRKAEAMDAYRSQTEPLSDHPADAAVVPDSVLQHFRRPFETVLEHAAEPDERSIPAQVFDDMYASGDDPWHHEDSWYEKRKRAVTLAALPTRRLGRVLELGPATGLLTLDLARRAQSVACVEASEQALERTRSRVAEEGLSDRVQLHHGRVPETWPDGSFDTVVVSEVAYFLTRSEWAATLRRIGAALSEEATLVLVHWTHPLQDCPLDTATAHAMAARKTGLVTVVEHVEADFTLLVLRPRGLPSIAAAEGLC